MNYFNQSPQNIYVAGHRGWLNKYPENTIPSFMAAIELGVDQIETDVRITKDGELVLIHDETVNRTTNGIGAVRDYTLAELKELDAGSYMGKNFKNVRIPTFREFFELIKDHPTLTVNIELKEYPDREPGWDKVAFSVCDRVVKMVEEYNFKDRVLLNSFSLPLMEYIKKNHPDYKRHVFFPLVKMLGEGENPYDGAYCACVYGPEGTEKCMATAEEIIDFHKKTGIKIWMGKYIHDEKTVDLAIPCGVELITCNNPDEILNILRKKGLHK